MKHQIRTTIWNQGFQYKKYLLIIFAIIINGQSKQPSEMELDVSTKIIFLNNLILISDLSNLILSIYLI